MHIPREGYLYACVSTSEENAFLLIAPSFNLEKRGAVLKIIDRRNLRVTFALIGSIDFVSVTYWRGDRYLPVGPLIPGPRKGTNREH